MNKQYRNYPDSVIRSKEQFAHVGAMTSESLHGKSEIASELAYRDIINKGLRAEIEQLKKENELMEDAINTIGESALGGSGDHSSAPYDCEDIYKICCALTTTKQIGE